MGDDPSVVSVTMFLSCNRNPDKLQAGKDIFIRFALFYIFLILIKLSKLISVCFRVFNNIIANPAEEKFQKLKCSTNAYKVKCAHIRGFMSNGSTGHF